MTIAIHSDTMRFMEPIITRVNENVKQAAIEAAKAKKWSLSKWVADLIEKALENK